MKIENKSVPFSPVLFRQLFDQTSCTYTYLLADKKSGISLLIDTVYEQYQRDVALVQELELELLYTIDTHCHADHVTGGWLVRQELGSGILASKGSGITGLDRALTHGDRIEFGDRYLQVLETPGHTDGCISLLMDDNSMVFTGDALLIRGCGRTDFQQGSSSRLFHSITGQIFTLPDECLVYPAHDYAGRMVSTVGEERRLNPRIGGAANEADFVGYMENMRMPHPRKLDIAVPANLQAGKPPEGEAPARPSWAPVVITYSGVQEISPQWVAVHQEELHILDVRTRVETEEEQARLPNAQMIPINELRDRIAEVPRTRPVVTICRSGRRSVLAANILRENGWDRVANVSGGFLQWYAEGLPLQTAGTAA